MAPIHRQYKSKSAGEWHKVKASREEEQRYSKQMEREESKVRLPLWCRVLTDCRR